MSFKKSLLYFYSLLLIYSCGGGGGGGGSDSIPAQAAPPPNPAPTVALSLSFAQVGINENALITYSTTNASTCEASGAWSGSKAHQDQSNLTLLRLAVLHSFFHALVQEEPLKPQLFFK